MDFSNKSWETSETPSLKIVHKFNVLPEGDTSASEIGWQQGFDLMEATWEISAI